MTTPDDIIEQRVAHEREWAYGHWLARLSFTQIRQLAGRPESEGGLGYDLSEHAIKGLVKGARDARGDLGMTRDERIDRQSAEVDERARAARSDLAAAYARARKLDEVIADFQVWDKDDARALTRLVEERDALGISTERADNRLGRIEEREAKLHGLDAATEARLDVTVHDGLTDELNAMLGRAGLKPIEVRHD